MFHVTQHPYCGLSMPRHTFEDSTEARADGPTGIGHHCRAGLRVTILERGASWEVHEPEGAAMVPDACGTIGLHREQFECRECGAKWDDRPSAGACCILGLEV